MRTGHFLETAGDQVGILTAVAVPVVPPLACGARPARRPSRVAAAIAAGVLSLAGFAVREARAAGLGWGRSLGIAAVLLAAGIGLLWLEVSLH